MSEGGVDGAGKEKAEITKYKKLLMQAKRAIQEGQQKVKAREAEIEKLHSALKNSRVQGTASDSALPAPRRILCQVWYNQSLWCLVEFMDEDVQDVWRKFTDEEELRVYIRRDAGEPLSLPKRYLSPEQSERMQQSTQQELERLKTEFRKYRIKAEISRKQNLEAIKKAQASGVAVATKQMSADDMQELKATKKELKAEKVLRQDAEARGKKWHLQYKKELIAKEQLEGSLGETNLAAKWRERYEAEKEEKEMLINEQQGEGGVQLLDKHKKLQEDFRKFKKQTLEIIEEREAQLRMCSGGIAGSAGVGNTSDRKASLDAKDTEYLKNIVLQYMTGGDEVKKPMEMAIATVLRFTADEQQLVRNSRTGGSGLLSNFMGM